VAARIASGNLAGLAVARTTLTRSGCRSGALTPDLLVLHDGDTVFGAQAQNGVSIFGVVEGDAFD